VRRRQEELNMIVRALLKYLLCLVVLVDVFWFFASRSLRNRVSCFLLFRRNQSTRTSSIAASVCMMVSDLSLFGGLLVSCPVLLFTCQRWIFARILCLKEAAEINIFTAKFVEAHLLGKQPYRTIKDIKFALEVSDPNRKPWERQRLKYERKKDTGNAIS
jgi:hypothetical protein